MRDRSTLLRLLTAAALLSGCGSDEKVPCDPDAQTGCSGSEACEIIDAVATCVPPVVLTGHVTALADGAAIAGARVVALDVNNAPVAPVVTTDGSGAYSLPIRHERVAGGAPIGRQITLHADAQGYVSFPSGLRLALPIDTSSAALESGEYVVSSQTDIKLDALAGAGTGSIAGTIELPGASAGAVVVAESGTAPDVTGHSAVVDDSGKFVIFNLDAGTYTVRGFAKGANYDSQDVTVAADQQAQATLHLNVNPAATVSGDVQIVAGGEGTVTSVVLAVASTFDEVTARGVIPMGLRAPESGEPTLASGDTWTIAGVPDGRYVVLAAYENDHLVRDPDTCIAGTGFVYVDVVNGAAVPAGSFKITGAVEINGPGAAGPEALTAAPQFSWQAVPSTDHYEVIVFDSFGNEVWSDLSVPAATSPVTLDYGGPALTPDEYYQFRVTAIRLSGGASCEASQSEDLKGVFYLAP